MLIRIWMGVIASVFCLSTLSARANEFTDSEYPDKWNSSIILNVGWATAKNACTSPWIGDFDPTMGSYCSESHQAYRLAFDHQITPAWGFEVSYGDFGNAQGRGYSLTTGLGELWAMKVGGWAIDATRTFHLVNKLSLFGKLGFVRAEFTESISPSISSVVVNGATLSGVNIINTNRFGPTYGLGLQYDLNDRYAIRAQYENFGKYDIYSTYGVSAPKIGLSMLSAGLVLKF